jgi:hypothetical protein
VTTNAIASDSAMPIDALIGIGLMYGPIRPVTNAIGNSAAMTVSVARIVGPPTSSTAPGIRRASAARPPGAGRSTCASPRGFHRFMSRRGTVSVELTACRELLVAVDVLDDHDCIVDQDADREDQREE